MGIITNRDGTVHILGNFTKARRYKDGRPRDWIDRDWKAIIPYPFKWRTKLGKVECTCVECIESYMPYYGSTWYHEENCAITKHIRKYPQMLNFMWDYDPMVIAQNG